MANFRPFTYRLPNTNEPVIEVSDRGPLAPYQPAWSSDPQALVNPKSKTFGRIGASAGIIGGLALVGRTNFRGRKGWDYYHSLLLGIEEYSPGRMFRTFQLSGLVSPLTTLGQAERFISPEALQAMEKLPGGREQIKHLERLIGKSFKELGVFEQGFTFKGGKLYLGKTRQVILKHAQVFLNPMQTPSTLGLGYARHVAGKAFVPESILTTPIDVLRAGESVARPEYILFRGGQTRFQSLFRGFAGYGTSLIERLNRLAEAPFEMPPFKWVFSHVPGLKSIKFAVTPGSGLTTLARLTGKLGIAASLAYGAYSYLDYAARKSETLDKTLLGEGITAGVATLWTRANLAISRAADKLGLHDYREWQERIAPRSTDLGTLLAFPLMGGLTGLGIGYAERLAYMASRQYKGFSVTEASHMARARNQYLGKMLYDPEFAQQVVFQEKGGQLVSELTERNLSRKFTSDQWRKILAGSGDVVIDDQVFRGAGLPQQLTEDVLKLRSSFTGRITEKWSQLVANAEQGPFKRFASKYAKITPTEVRALLGIGVGLGLVLPFIPGALLPDQRPEELEAIYSGRKPVPVRKGRWWEFGRSPYEGENIMYYRPHWYPRMLARGRDKAIYGEEELSPLQKFYMKNFTYELEKKHYFDRPYPVSGTAFQDVPLVGPLLAATLGRLVKPPRLMHTDEWARAKMEAEGSGDQPASSLEYASMPQRYGYQTAPGELPEGKPISPYGLKGVLGEQAYRFTEMIGLPGFTFGAIKERITGEETFFAQEAQLESAQRLYGAERAYWDLEVGGGLGTTELFRRLYPHRRREIPLYNPIRNRMPEWLPGPGERSPDFLHGDPYAKVQEGEIRLPGAGYAAFYPELEGVAAEDYPLIHKYKILADVAPYSSQFDQVQQQMKAAQRQGQVSEQETAMLRMIDEQLKARRQRKVFYPYQYKDRAYASESEAALAAWNEAQKEKPSAVESALGRYWEILAHNAETPMESLTPLSPYNKLVHVRTALEEYEAFQVYGTKNAFWGNPYRDFLRPFGSSLQHSLGINAVPTVVKERRELEEYFDMLKYVKYTGLERQSRMAGDLETAQTYAGKRRETLFGVDPYTYNYSDIFRSLPRRERDYFNEFVKADLEERERLMRLLPTNEQRLYQARWELQDAINAKKAMKKGLLTEKQTKDAQFMIDQMYDRKRTEGMPVDKQLWVEYLRDRLPQESYADWYRRTYLLAEQLDGRPLPGPDWIGWHPMVDMEDIKLKIVQGRKENPIDYDIWPDQERLLARRPEVAGGAQALQGRSSPQEIRRNLSDILMSHHLGGASVSLTPASGTPTVNITITQDRREDIAYIGKKYNLN